MGFPHADKTILLGVCGSIAAFRACELASQLTRQGVRVLTAMTHSACELVGPSSFEAITGNPVITELFSPISSPEIEHIAIARRADLFVIAPATANIIAKAAHGIADDWLSTTLLATRAPILFAPAMNVAMYEHPATQTNIALLRSRGVHFVGPEYGKLACGEEGMGRLADMDALLDAITVAMHPVNDYAGKRVLITSGPNQEPMDPVRYIGNRSSGKMGRALALEALRRGASVCVISGPAACDPPHGVEIIYANTAADMHKAVMERLDSCDIVIGAAAVADYRILHPASDKLKRGKQNITITLTPNPDIIAEVAAARPRNVKVVGFAAESTNILENAQRKLVQKGLDMIVANAVGGDHCAIGADAGEAWLLVPNTSPEPMGRMDKALLAQRIFDKLLSLA